MGVPKIKQVQDNQAKARTYKELMEQYRKSMECGFYGEAELIVYALLEDRLRSFLFHIGAIEKRTDSSTGEKMSALLQKPRDVKNISDKADIIRKSFRHCQQISVAEEPYADYLRSLYLDGVDVSQCKKLLKSINDWCSYRNEIIHGLFHKDLEDLRQSFRSHVEEGFDLAKELHKHVQAVKRSKGRKEHNR
ncbi:MAG: hypothetical protein II272_09360 [Oscillospiraceae bacterium]|nr:hypothetical protein [Oscillospiraceae bacterium]